MKNQACILKSLEQQPLKKLHKKYNQKHRDFPGGAVVKNLPANAGDTGLSPAPGRSHMPRGSWACAPQLLRLRSRALEPQLLKPACLEPVLHNKRSHHNEKPMHSNEEWPPHATIRESPCAATKTQRSQK